MLAFWSAHEVPNLHRLLEELQACLVPGGKLLVVEPKWHVSARSFTEMTETAGEVGFTPVEEPRIRLSKAVAFEKA